MKTIITLTDTKESLDFIKSINIEKLKENMTFVYVCGYVLDIVLKGDYYISYTGLSFWIENDEGTILRIPTHLIKDLCTKDIK